uniref:Uncharacterized protein n=1 Tax=Piliocolobus tephrosceles TaxID=591936 RepID=A0A8C9GTZ1_9PRIM
MQPPKSEAPAFRQLRQAPLLPPDVSLSRPGCSLLASSPGPALPPGCINRPNSCLTATSLDSDPAKLLVAFVGPKLPQAKLSRPSSGIIVASPEGSDPALQRIGLSGPGSSSQRPLQAQVALKSASPGPAPASPLPLQAQVVLKSASPAPALASWQPLWVHNFLLSASPGPAPPLLPPCSLCRAKSSSRQPTPTSPLQVQLLLPPDGPARLVPLGGLPRHRFDFWRPLQGQNLTSSWHLWTQPPASRRHVYRPSVCLTADSPTPRAVDYCLTLAILGRGPPSRWPVQAQLMPLMASPSPVPSCERPLQAQRLPCSLPSSDPPLASSWLPWSKLWPFGGLCRYSSCLPVASVGQAHSSLVAFPGLVFPALYPLQALHFLQSATPGPDLPPSGLCTPKFPSSRPPLA